jgi:DNA (cytosine-5)-methyltransferase 1
MHRSELNIRREREALGLSQAKLAELTRIPQHLLSAFELGKAELPAPMLESLTHAFSDDRRITELASRRKRYRRHRYERVAHSPERVARAKPTKGNAEYLRLLNWISERHASPAGRQLQAVSLFSGCGGFSLGFSAARFRIRGFLELDAALRKIYRSNFPVSQELGSDITAVSQATLEAYRHELGTIDVIIGGPPCQGFSLSGKRKVDDPRNSLFRHYLRFVDVFQPRMAVLENVRLLTSMKSPSGSWVKDEICSEFQKHGYSVRYFEVNAKEYGVPQHRERVFFVAVRKDLGVVPSIPDVTHGPSRDLFSEVTPYRTFGDACSDLPFLESGESSDDLLHQAVRHPAHVIQWLWDVPEGCSAHENKDPRLRPPSGYNTTYKRQVWNEPASTVQTTFGMISGCRNVHPIATRSLTIREAARIQSFPDSYRFQGTASTVRTGVGNAVPPLLAYAIGLHVRDVLS